MFLHDFGQRKKRLDGSLKFIKLLLKEFNLILHLDYCGAGSNCEIGLVGIVVVRTV